MDNLPSPDNVNTQPASTSLSWDMYKRRLYLTVGLVAFLIVLANFVSATLGMLLLLFLCVLTALGLHGVSSWIADRTPISDTLALALTVLAVIVLFGGMLLLVGSRLAAEFSALASTLQASLGQLEQQVRQYTWGEQLFQQMPTVTELGQRLLSGNTELFSRITGIFSATLSLFSYALIVIFVSLFLAAQPAVYRDNFLRLIPKERRARIHQTLSLVAHTLQRWLLTRIISVVVIGILTVGGLLLMDIPLALSLGIVAAVAGFIPTFGPILALIPALLVAFTTTPGQFLGVLVLYLGIQIVDNYLITPAVQKEMLRLPPAYVIVMQLLFGIIAGSFGLILAAPLATALVIIVRLLYVEDVLGDKTEKQPH